MTSAFILAKSSRSPLKSLRDRLIPAAAAIGNGGRQAPSPQGGEQGGYTPDQDLLGPLAVFDHEHLDREEL
jgi:hypothetical protein